MNYNFPYTLEREDANGDSICYELDISGSYRFGAPQTWTDPADPDEFEIDTVDGLPDGVTLTDDEYSAIELWAYENPPEEDDYYPED